MNVLHSCTSLYRSHVPLPAIKYYIPHAPYALLRYAYRVPRTYKVTDGAVLTQMPGDLTRISFDGDALKYAQTSSRHASFNFTGT